VTIKLEISIICIGIIGIGASCEERSSIMSFVISGMKSHVFKEMKDIEAYTLESPITA
jgi:hypothetical protein